MPAAPRKLRVSLCLIVWNEVQGCQWDVPRIPRDIFEEIFAVDGGSNDGTVSYLEEAGIPVHRQPVKSLNAAYHHAVEKARGDALVVFFPKATLDPACLHRLVELLEEGNELVIASRNIAGARNEEDEGLFRPRKWGVQALSHLASLIWRREGPRINDVLHGVKAFTLDAWHRMQISGSGVTVDLETVVRAYRLRLRRIEFPVIENARLHGLTKFRILPTAKRLGRFLWEEFFSPKALDR